MAKRTITIDDAADRWRYRCPVGHANWEPTNSHFFCEACARSHDPEHNPVFEELRDKRSGDLLERNDVVLENYEDHLRHVKPTSD